MSADDNKTSELSIRKRIIILVVLPVVVATFFLNYYLTVVRLDDADTTLALRGELISGYLAIAAEYGLVTGDKSSLQNLVDFSARKPDISKIVILDRERRIVSQSGSAQPSLRSNWFLAIFLKARKPIAITEAVTIAGFNVLDGQEDLIANDITTEKKQKIIGWIKVEVSPRSLIIQQQEILTSSLFVALFCLVLGILLSLQTERLVTRPILQLARIVQSIRDGQYKTSAGVSLPGELGLLEKGLNEMAVSLGEQHEQLRLKIADATMELTTTINELELKNTQLEQSQHEVTKASQAKEEFLARMSHEIRTPMNAVIGYATLLKQTQLAHDQQEYTRIINRAAHQLLTVIDDILIFTKLESGVVSIENIEFDLQESLEDVISMLSQSAHDKALELVLLIYSDVPVLLKGDPVRINQILINLVNNAIKFTSHGSVVVHVEVGNETNEMIEIRISVDDTGPGIHEDQQANLFEEFTQADSTITRRFGGTGLGLPIAKKLAELMQGSIGVDSTSGEGSRFWFRVKCEKISRDVSSLRYAGLDSKKILVYDENQFSVRAIRNNLLRWGINVFTARSMDKSRDMLSIAQYDNNTPYDFAVFGLSLEECTDENFQFLCSKIRDVFEGPLLFLLAKEPNSFPNARDNNIQLQRKPITRMALFNSLCKQFKLKGTRSNINPSVVPTSKPIQACHILVVEDNVFNRDLVATLLQKQNIFVHLAENAQQAIEVAKKNNLDLILMDIHLPDMSGLEAAKRIREIKSNNTIDNTHVPIIALTADVFLDKKSTLHEATMVDCIVKPISEAAFWNTLKKYLPKQEISAELVSDVPDLHVSQKESLNKNMSVILDDIANLILQQDWQAIAEQIHQLKGLVGYYQLHAFTHLLSAMEKSSISTDSVELKKLLTQAYHLNAELV